MLVAGTNLSAFALTEAEIQKEIDKLEQQSQQITAQSRKGEGTTITITLPNDEK